MRFSVSVVSFPARDGWTMIASSISSAPVGAGAASQTATTMSMPATKRIAQKSTATEERNPAGAMSVWRSTT